MNGKITVFGAGNVGGAVTRRLIERKLCKKVVLVDRSPGKAEGIALDILEASPIDLLEPVCLSGEDLEQTRDSEVVIITAGARRTEGMSRDDLLKINAEIVGECAAKAAKYSPYAFYIVVSNPLNVMCHVAMRAGQIPRTRVTGMAGIPITELLPPERIEALVSRTRDGGAEIIRLMQVSAFYAPASAVSQMVSAVVMNKRKILPCAAYLTGEYGIKDTFVGVPVKLGANGVEEIMHIELSDAERAALQASAEKIRRQVGTVFGTC